jgi:hypothetical protein
VGVERVISHDPAVALDWSRVAARLVESGETPVVRMIDGLPAFPDEVPEGDWTEVRVGLSGGMVTVRRQPGRVSCVTWGTDDPGLRKAADALYQAIAAAVNGTIE